jgi:hypothetical protein
MQSLFRVISTKTAAVKESFQIVAVMRLFFHLFREKVGVLDVVGLRKKIGLENIVKEMYSG